MSTRARLAIAAAIALLSAIGIGVLVARWASGGAHAPAPFGLRETGAVTPFAGYREVRANLDGRCRRLVVADTPARRAQGLRGHEHLGPYAGMLFVTAHDTADAFTMAGVGTPLDVAWYSADGTRVGGARMRPCPKRAGHRCPVYPSPRRYRVALELPGGVGPPAAPASLVPCS